MAPLLSAANAGSFHLRYQDGRVLIEQASFAGVDTAAVDAAVSAAPSHTDALDQKAAADDIPKYLRAFFQVLVDEINRLRQNPTTTYAAITYAQAWTAVKTRIDSL